MNARRGWVIGAVVVVLIGAALLASAMSGGSSDDSGDSGGTSSAVQETATVKVEGTALPAFQSNGASDKAVGKEAPTLIGEDFDGASVSTAPDGKPQVLIVVVHSCPHCQAEVPRIVALADDGVFDGVTVTAIPTSTNEAADNYPPSSWLEREKWPFRVLLDDTQGTAAIALGTTFVPYFVMLDADGTVVARVSSEIPSADLEAMLADLKSGSPVSVPGADSGSTRTG